MTSQPIPTDVLLSHAAFLRRLARGLLADEAQVDDVLQDTWMTALERPPRERTALRGWLARVAQTLALKRLRGDARRRRREERGARPEGVASHVVLGERDAMLRAVVESVLGLGDAQREVVLLHDFEDLPPREIARRLGVPVETVKSRLKRARAVLRGRLEATWESGDEDRPAWTRALAVAVGAGRPPATPPLRPTPSIREAGVVGMSVQVKLIGTVVAASALIGLYLVNRPADAALESVVERTTSTEGPADDRLAVLDEVPDRPTRESQGAPSESADGPDVPGLELDGYAFELEVVDLDGQPVAGLTLLAAPRGHALNDVGRTDGEGRLHRRWNGAGASAVLVLQLRRHGSDLGPLRSVEFARGIARPIQLVVDIETRRRSKPVYVAEPSEPGATRRGPAMARLGRDGQLLFVDDSAPAGTLAERVDVERQLDLDRRALVASAARAGDTPGRLRCTVLDASSRAVANAPVCIRRDGVVLVRRTRADETGLVEQRLAPGEYEIEAGGGRWGSARATVTIEAHGEHDEALVLNRRIELRGIVVDSDGAPLRGMWVEAEDDPRGPSWSAAAVTGDDGRFSIADCPPGPMQLTVRRRFGAPPLPDATLVGAVAGGEYELVVAAEEPSSIRLQLLDSAAERLGAAEVRAWTADGTRGWRMPLSGSSCGFDLRPGVYRTEVGAPGHEWHALSIDAPPGVRLELGEVRLAARADLRIEPTPAEEAKTIAGLVYELRRLLPDGESITSVDALPSPAEVRVPAGHYRLLVGAPQGGESEVTFDVQAGQRLTKRVDLAR